MASEQQQLEVSRVIRADRERVFRAWTDPKMIIQWWGAGGVRCTQAEMDLTVGGAYRIANETPEGMTMWIAGTFKRVDPPQSLTYSWAMEPIEPDTIHSLVDVSFADADGGTLVTVVHTQIPTTEAREMNLGGWIGCLDGLDRLLAS